MDRGCGNCRGKCQHEGANNGIRFYIFDGFCFATEKQKKNSEIVGQSTLCVPAKWSNDEITNLWDSGRSFCSDK